MRWKKREEGKRQAKNIHARRRNNKTTEHWSATQMSYCASFYWLNCGLGIGERKKKAQRSRMRPKISPPSFFFSSFPNSTSFAAAPSLSYSLLRPLSLSRSSAIHWLRLPCVKGSYKSRWLCRSTWTFTSHLSRRQHSPEILSSSFTASSSRLTYSLIQVLCYVGYPTPPSTPIIRCF